MSDPWDNIDTPKVSLIKKGVDKKPEKVEFTPTQTLRDTEIWKLAHDDVNPNAKEGKFDVIETIDNDKEFIDEVNAEIMEVLEREKLELETKESEKIESMDPIADLWKKSGDIIVSYSTIDKIFYKGNEIPHCPAKIYGRTIGLEEPPTEPMMAGSLFETLLLGGGRDGKQTMQIKRKQVSQKAKNEALKKGLPEPEPEMTIDEVRIRQQVDRSKIFFFNHKINIMEGINTQVPVYKIYNGIKIWGHLDLFPTPIIWNGEERLAVIDTKLTGNLSSSFGKYCWAQPDQIDITQAIVYYFLLEDIDYSINPYLLKIFGKERQFQDLIFLYYVADYKVAMDKLDCKFFEVTKTPARMQEIKETIRKTHATLEMYQEQGWPANPHYDLCKNCVQNFKAAGNCQYAINVQTI